MKTRTWTIVVLLATALLVAGCGGDGGSDAASEDGADAGVAASQESVALDVWLEENYGDTAWFAAIDRVEETTKLRVPVTEIWFSVSGAEVANQYQMDLNTAVNEWAGETGTSSFYIQTFGTDGGMGGFGNSSSEDVVTLPAAPESFDGLAGWMDAAWGPGSGMPVEEWYGHVTGYDFETDAWDGEKVIVVKTDLPAMETGSPERDTVDLIRYAVAAAHPDWATNIRVEDATETNLSTGQIPETIPYGGY
jgi:hypothetical protein